MNLHYTQTGVGKDLIIIHGWTSSGRMWDRVVPMLSDNFRCWVIDLPGNGETPLDEDATPTIDYYAESILDFCDAHQIQPYGIVAHSMGGMITLKIMTMRPEFTEKLVLVSPVVTGSVSLFGQLAKRIICTPLGVSFLKNSRSIWGAFRVPPLNYVMAYPIYAGMDVVNQAREDFVRCDWKAIAHSLISIAQEDFAEALPHIQQPTLLVVGKRDYTVPAHESEIAADGLPNVDFQVYEKAFHHPHDEFPERFREEVLTFLR